MITRTCLRALIWLLVLLIATPPWVFAQSQAKAAPTFKQEELDQMLSPIALYPDSLLVQVLMAATYPLEIVEADRWVKNNPNLKGDKLTAALEKQNWDPSVKSLVNFPSVIAMMSDKLEWAQKLGDAFLSQQKDVMNTVQKLRAKAQAQGSLKSTSEQKVIVQEKTIVIEPASPQVVYVPAYNPAVVYGQWWYPAYPPYPYYPPGYVAGAAAFSFAAGVAVGAAWGYAWGSPNWSHGNVNVNVNQNNTINNNINRNNYIHNTGTNGHGEWHHDPDHRKGVAYRDNTTAQRYGQTSRGNPDARKDYRGTGSTNQPKAAQSTNRPEGKEGRDTAGRDRTGMQQGKGSSAQERQGLGAGKTAGAFEGMDQGGRNAQTHSDRGRESRQTMTSAGGGRMGGGGGASHGGGHRR